MLNEIFSSLVAKPQSSTVLVTKPASEHNPEPVSSSSHSHNLFSKTIRTLSPCFPLATVHQFYLLKTLYTFPFSHTQDTCTSNWSLLHFTTVTIIGDLYTSRIIH